MEQYLAHSRIREIRKAKRMTLAEVSANAGFSIPYLSDIERGNRHGSCNTLQRIADALGVAVKDLLTDDQKGA